MMVHISVPLLSLFYPQNWRIYFEPKLPPCLFEQINKYILLIPTCKGIDAEIQREKAKALQEHRSSFFMPTMPWLSQNVETFQTGKCWVP